MILQNFNIASETAYKNYLKIIICTRNEAFRNKSIAFKKICLMNLHFFIELDLSLFLCVINFNTNVTC